MDTNFTACSDHLINAFNELSMFPHKGIFLLINEYPYLLYVSFKAILISILFNLRHTFLWTITVINFLVLISALSALAVEYTDWTSVEW